MPSSTGLIILAAGEGKRMKSQVNKVVLPLGGKPMVSHIVTVAKKIKLSVVVVVIGHAKESVVKTLGNDVLYVEQEKRLGTANAVFVALKKIPKNVTDILVVNGDDSAFYTEDLILRLVNEHRLHKSDITFLSITVPNPKGLGRVVRDQNEKLIKIVEEKDATFDEKNIQEVNTGCYVFRADFLREYIHKIKKSAVTGEYYLTSIIDLALSLKKRVHVVSVGNYPWRGINTVRELEEANKLFRKYNNERI